MTLVQSRVLVALHPEATTVSLAETMRAWGHEVETCDQSIGCEELAVELKPHFLIFDYAHPGIDACHLAQRVRSHLSCAGTRFIVVAEPSNMSQQKSLEEVFDVFLPKPLNLDALRTVLSMWGPRE